MSFVDIRPTSTNVDLSTPVLDNSERESRMGHRRRSGSCQYGHPSRIVHRPAPKLRKNPGSVPIHTLRPANLSTNRRWIADLARENPQRVLGSLHHLSTANGRSKPTA